MCQYLEVGLLSRKLKLNEMVKVGPKQIGLVLLKEDEVAPEVPCTEERPCEDTTRTQPCTSHEEVPPETNPAGTFILEFQHLEL